MAPKLKKKKTPEKSKVKKVVAEKTIKAEKVVEKLVKKPVEKSVKKIAKKVVKKTVEKADNKSGKTPGLKTRFRSTPKKRIGKMPRLKKVRSRIAASIKIRKIRSKDVILVLDFGSQYTQLIARRIRENKVYSKIVPYNISVDEIKALKPKGLVFSGGPMSVYDKGAPMPNKEIFKLDIPILGICYGLQVISHMLGGKIKSSKEREFGRAELFVDSNKDLFFNCPTNLTCWMSHSDEIKKLPSGFVKIAHTLNAPIAGFANRVKKIFGVQFHPEVVHTQRGTQVLTNFMFQICGCLPRWTMSKFIDSTIKMKPVIKINSSYQKLFQKIINQIKLAIK